MEGFSRTGNGDYVVLVGEKVAGGCEANSWKISVVASSGLKFGRLPLLAPVTIIVLVEAMICGGDVFWWLGSSDFEVTQLSPHFINSWPRDEVAVCRLSPHSWHIMMVN